MRRALRTMWRFAEAAAVGDGCGGACFEIDKAASPMSRVRQKHRNQYRVLFGMFVSLYPYAFRSSATYSSHTGYPEESAFDASLGGRLASSSSE